LQLGIGHNCSLKYKKMTQSVRLPCFYNNETEEKAYKISRRTLNRMASF